MRTNTVRAVGPPLPRSPPQECAAKRPPGADSLVNIGPVIGPKGLQPRGTLRASGGREEPPVLAPLGGADPDRVTPPNIYMWPCCI